MFKYIKSYWFTLAFFSAITTGFTSLIYILTKPIIDNQIIIEKIKIFNTIIKPKTYDNNLLKTCYLIDKNQILGNINKYRLYIASKKGKPMVGIIETIAPDGYSGTIKLIVACDFYGKIIGARVIEHHETPGLGDKIDIHVSNWMNFFSGKTVNSINDKYWAVKKDGGIFDQFTGATITPRAVINAIKRSALFIKSISAHSLNYPKCSE